MDKESKNLFDNNDERLFLTFNSMSIKELHRLYITLTKYITPNVFHIN